MEGATVADGGSLCSQVTSGFRTVLRHHDAAQPPAPSGRS